MKNTVFALLLSCSLIGSGLISVPRSMAQEDPLSKMESPLSQSLESNSLVPVIIELDHPGLIEDKLRITETAFYSTPEIDLLDSSIQSEILAQQDYFLTQLQQDGVSFSYEGESCTIVANSLAMKIKGIDLAKIASFPSVKHIWSNEILYYPSRYIAAQTTRAIDAWTGVSGNLGVTGKNIRVGVIDSGLDTTHRDFQKRVKGGHDFGDKDNDYNDRTGHGTHVAGIIAGQSTEDKFFVGMAPNAYLYIYKVFSSSSSGASTQNITMALEESIKDKCDVVNMSLGYESGEPATSTGYYAESIRNADKAGVMVVVAAGNEGSRGKKQKYAIGSPSTIDVCLSVAATDDRGAMTFAASKGGEYHQITGTLAQYSPAFTPNLSGLGLVDCGFGSTDEVALVQLTNKIALVQRGPQGSSALSFRVKHDNVLSAGAKAVIFYNYVGTEKIAPSLFAEGEDPQGVNLIPSCMITNADGKWLLNAIESNDEEESDQKPLYLDFSKVAASQLATFTSQGSCSDGWFKPEIATPGTNIHSTYPRNSYALNSGTSMASPVMAGLVALLKEAKPSWTNVQIKSAFMNTADIMMNLDNGLPATFTLQGAGQARVDRAIDTPAFVNPPALVVKENEILPYAKSPNNAVPIVFTNPDKKEKQLSLSTEVFLLKDEVNPVTISLDQSTIKLAGDSSATVNVSFAVDKDLLQRGLYEGVIRAGELHIPFIVYRDSSTDDVQAISDIQIEPQEVVFTDTQTTDEISIQFSLNSGTEQSWEGFAGGSSYTNFGTISLYLVDEYGERWGEIATYTSLLIGAYRFEWNGKNNQGNYFLPKGKFHIQIDVSNWEVKGNSRKDFIDTYSSRQELEVVQSNVREPGTMIASVNKQFESGDPFDIMLILEEATDVVGVEFEFTYNGEKLSCDGAMDAGFFSADGADVEIEEDIDDREEGWGHITMNRYPLPGQPDGVSGTHVKIARLLFDSFDYGRMQVHFFNCKLLYADGQESKLRLRGGSFKVEKNSNFLLCDLNHDDIVDKYDLRIFKEHYSTKAGDDDYDKDCDFNQDERVNVDDLQIFGREYRKMI